MELKQEHKIGVHRTTGNNDGYGNAAPHMVCVTSFEAGAFDEAPIEAIKIYRTHDLEDHKDAPGDFDQLTDEELPGAAEFWWEQLKAIYKPVRDAYKNVYFQPVNEVNNVRMPIYMGALCKLAQRDGYKLALFGDAAGSPDLPDWERLWIPLFKEVQDGGHIYVRHAYSGVEQQTVYLTNEDGTPSSDNTARPFIEAELMRKAGITMPLFITELGWLAGWNSLPPEWEADLLRYNKLMMEHDNIGGSCVWNIGQWETAPNIFAGAPMRQLGAMLSTMEPAFWDGKPLNYTDETTTPEPVVPVEDGQIRLPYVATVICLPQDVSRIDVYLDYERGGPWAAVAEENDLLKRDVVQSHHSAVAMARAGMPGSTIVCYGERSELVDLAAEWDVQVEIRPRPDEEKDEPVEVDPAVFEFKYWPTTSKTITQVYGNNYNYYFNNFGLPGHEGIDIRAPHGAPIFAVADGIVKTVVRERENKANGGHNYGYHVRLSHADGYETIYAHMDEIRVSVGQIITAGQYLGPADNTGNSFGSHLHFTLKKDGEIIDPTPYLKVSLPIPTYVAPASKIDLRPYMGINGNQYMTQIISGDHAGAQEKYRIHLNNSRLMIQKGKLVEHYPLGSKYLYSNFDNSLDDKHGYRVELVNGGKAIRWPLDMAVGEEFWGTPHVVTTFNKVTGLEVQHPAAGIAQNYAKLVYQGRFVSPYSGRVYDDVIHMLTGTGENQYWQKWVGPVLWVADWGVMEYAQDQGNVATQTPEPIAYQDVLSQYGVH